MPKTVNGRQVFYKVLDYGRRSPNGWQYMRNFTNVPGQVECAKGNCGGLWVFLTAAAAEKYASLKSVEHNRAFRVWECLIDRELRRKREPGCGISVKVGSLDLIGISR